MTIYLKTFITLSLLILISNCSSKGGQNQSTNPSLALNGYEAGNGGVLIECPARGSSPQFEVLDFYRAKFELTGNYVFDFGISQKTVAEKIEYALARLRRVDPARADFYQHEVNTFWSRTKFTRGVTLPDTQDYGDLPADQACTPRQLVVQKLAAAPDGIQFLINEELWGKIDDDRRAAIVLHEIAYEDAIQRGQRNSRNVQIFVAIISSNRINTYDQATYNAFMIRLGMVSHQKQNPIWQRTPLDLFETYCTGSNISIDLSVYIEPSESPISFSSMVSPSWISLDSGGNLRGIVEGRDSVSVLVRASNGYSYSDNSIKFDVLDCAHSPLRLTAIAGLLFHGNLPRVSPRTYHKLAGPDWLFFNERSGDLSGTPPREVGKDDEQWFSFRASAPSINDIDVNVLIKIFPSNQNNMR